MVDKFCIKDIDKVNYLGALLNPKFKELFHIDNMNQNEEIYVYKENNVVLGFVHISKSFEVVDILNIVVDPDYRNQNIASILLDYLIGSLKENDRIMIEVKEDNYPAINLYNKFNFIEINRREKYYDGFDAIIMERTI